MAATLPESTQPEAVALVLWQGEGFLQVTVRVGRGGGQWVARALTFSERDSISERWTTVGLTVATLVGETRALENNAREPLPRPLGIGRLPQSPEAPEPVRVLAPRAVAAPAPNLPIPELHRWDAGAGFLSGPGWGDGDWQRGAWLSLAFHVGRTPFLLQAAVSYALSDGPRIDNGDLTTRWATVGLGAGAVGTWRALNLQGRALAEVAFRRVDTEWRGRAVSDHDFPLRLRTLLSFPADGALAATGGAIRRLPPTSPEENRETTVSGALAAEAVLGLEVRL